MVYRETATGERGYGQRLPEDIVLLRAHLGLHTAGQGAGQPASLVPAARAVTETGAAVFASGGSRKPRRGICRTRALRRDPDSGSIALIRRLIVNTNLAALAHRHGRSLLAKLDAALRWFEGGPVEAGRLRSALGIDPTEVRLTVCRLFPLPRTVRPHKNRDGPRQIRNRHTRSSRTRQICRSPARNCQDDSDGYAIAH
jgi:hypothetical protein